MACNTVMEGISANCSRVIVFRLVPGPRWEEELPVAQPHKGTKTNTKAIMRVRIRLSLPYFSA
jgi:hypothetical protein